MAVHKLEINEDCSRNTHQLLRSTHQPFFFSSIVPMSAPTGPFALVLFSAVFLHNLLGYNRSARIGLTAAGKGEGTERWHVKR